MSQILTSTPCPPDPPITARCPHTAPHCDQKVGPFKLIELNTIDDNLMTHHALAGLMQAAMRYRYAKDLVTLDRIFSRIIRKIEEKGLIANPPELFKFTIHYIPSTMDRADPERFVKRIAGEVAPKTRGIIMTMAERLRKSGEKIGIEKGIEKGREAERHAFASRLLQLGSEIAFVAKATKLSKVEVQKIQAGLNN